MRRKIIKQGRNTLTITLPNKWVKDYNIKQGNELEITEKGNILVITTEKKSEEQRIEIDISDLDAYIIWKILMGVYREGYDEVKLKFNSEKKYDSPFVFFTQRTMDRRFGKKPAKEKPISVIQKMMSRFIGFEIIEQHKDYCIVKDIAEISSKEFENSLRRIFLLIQQMAEEILEGMKTNDKEMLEQIKDIDINIDKFHDYCIRVLNKTGFKEVRKSCVLFSIIYLLEMLADEFKHMSMHLIKDNKTEKIDKGLINLGELVKEMFDSFYSLYYSFSMDKVCELSKKDKEIYNFLPEIYKRKHYSWVEIEVMNHFKRLVMYINAIIELRIEMEM